LSAAVISTIAITGIGTAKPVEVPLSVSAVIGEDSRSLSMALKAKLVLRLVCVSLEV